MKILKSGWGAAVGAAMMMTALGACGDDGLTRADRGELVVQAGGGENGLFVEFDAPRAGFPRDAKNEITIKNGNLGDLTITSIDISADLTGYISAKTTIPETPLQLTPEDSRILRFQVQIPDPNTDPEPLTCPPAPGNLPAGIDADRYCGQVVIRSGAPDNQSRTIYFQVSSSSGSVAVNPTVLTFENPQVGREITKELTITNESTSGELTVTSIDRVDFTGGADDRFAIDGFPFPLKLTPGDSATYNIIYSPETADRVQGKLLVNSDDPNRPTVTVSVNTGSAQAAQIRVDPTALIFPNAAPGTSEVKELTITNTGSAAALLIQNFLITGAGGDNPYTIEYDPDGDGEFEQWQNGNNDTIPRQNSKVYRVKYAPQSAESVTANLRILSNATNVPNGEVNVTLSGGEAAPAGLITPDNMIFDVAPGESDARDFAVRNEGLADLIISDVTFNGTIGEDEFSITPDPAGATVEPGELVSFTLNYDRLANDVGLDQGTIGLVTNDDVAGDLLINVRNNSQDNAISPTATIVQAPDGNVEVDTIVTFDGATSTANSGDIAYYAWTLVDRPAGSNAELSAPNDPSVTLLPDLPGTYRVQLVVGNSLSLEGAAVRDLIVE